MALPILNDNRDMKGKTLSLRSLPLPTVVPPLNAEPGKNGDDSIGHQELKTHLPMRREEYMGADQESTDVKFLTMLSLGHYAAEVGLVMPLHLRVSKIHPKLAKSKIGVKREHRRVLI